MLGKTSICSTLEASASIQALGGMFRTEQILANCGFYFDSSNPQDYNAKSELPGALLFAGLQVPVFCGTDRRCAGNYCNGRKNGPEHAGRRLKIRRRIGT
jgi:hypothetical protein